MSDQEFEQEIEQDDEATSEVGFDEGAAADDTGNELEQLRNENRQLYEKLARVQADYQNAQRRIEKEMNQRLQIAAGQLIKDFLPVLDNLQRASELPGDSPAQPVIDGVQGTLDQWLEVLSKNGVQRIAPEPGEPFNPGHHEALMQQPLPDGVKAQDEGQVVSSLLQAGFEFEGRVLRPAQVGVCTI